MVNTSKICIVCVYFFTFAIVAMSTVFAIKQGVPQTVTIPQEFDTLDQCVDFFASLDDTRIEWRDKHGIEVNEKAEDVLTFLQSLPHG